jgi:hypothetical protein
MFGWVSLFFAVKMAKKGRERERDMKRERETEREAKRDRERKNKTKKKKKFLHIFRTLRSEVQLIGYADENIIM